MIRKKRKTTQVDLFVQEEVLTPDPHVPPVLETPLAFEKITVTRGFENPILMGSLDGIRQEDTTSGEVQELPLPVSLHETTEREEISIPGTEPPQEEGNEIPQVKTEREHLIINRDFSDGFYLNESQKRTLEDKLLREELFLRRQIRHKRILKLTTVGLLSFAVLLLWNWQDWVINSSLFTLKTVFVQGSLMSNKDEIIRSADLDMGVRLAEVNVAKTAERIKTNPLFKTVTVSRNYPSSIVIHVTERQPFAFVLMDELHAVDHSGIVLPKLKAKMIYNLPIISGINTVATPGKKLNSNALHAALKFLEKAKEIDESVYYEISEIQIKKDDMVVYLNSMRATVRIDDENPERSVVYLGTAVPYFKQNENTDRIREIDLRYEGQILVKD